jgi:hypothetical protein
MKNLFLAAAILAAGITSARTLSLKGTETTPLKSKEAIAIKNSKSQKIYKLIVLKATGRQVWIAQTDCGWTATTTQDWTPAQANAWLQQLNANYCGGN